MVQQHQRGRNTRSVRQSRAHALRLSGAMALILGSVAARHLTASSHNARPLNGVTTLTPIRYEAKQTTPTEQPPVPVLVSVDGQDAPAADSTPLADALRGFAILPDSLPNAAPDSGSTPLPAWFELGASGRQTRPCSGKRARRYERRGVGRLRHARRMGNLPVSGQ